MSDQITIQLSGTKDVLQAFADLREQLPKNPLRYAVRAGATVLLEAIKQVAPVGATGVLSESLRVNVTARGGNTVGRVVIDNRAFYWRFLELGWRSHGRGQRHQHPFVTPAFHAHETQAAQEVIDACEREVRKAQAKLDRINPTPDFPVPT
jgi:HK97 gp10 family phage protein